MQRVGDRLQQHCDQYHEQQGDQSHGQPRGGEGLVGVDILLVGEAEKGGLHAEGEDDEKQGSVGIKIRHDAVAARFGSDFVGIERHQQVVQEPTYNAAQAVNGGLLRQGAQSVVCHRSFRFRLKFFKDSYWNGINDDFSLFFIKLVVSFFEYLY